MTATHTHRQLCGHFAALLGYPQGDLGVAVRACRTLLGDRQPSAAAALERFGAFVAAQNAWQVEEVYTATFDLQAVYHPYVGYQLFGESKQRALFLVKLQECYREHGYIVGGELADHLSEVLGFLETAQEPAARDELVRDALLPALAKMVQGQEEAQHPYGDILRALQDFLSGDAATAVAAPSTEAKKELQP